MSEQPKVAVVMGSHSDLPVMEATVKTLREMGVEFELRVMSAHRSPDETHRFASEAQQNGLRVIIAGAGGAAHLAGVIASKTDLPVIGVPMPTGRAGGIDSLLSTLQMPRGVPVATMGIGKSGATNAALLAVQILALCDEKIAHRWRQYRAALGGKVQEADRRVQEWLAQQE